MGKVRVVFFADILISDFDGASRTMFQLIGRIPDEQFEFLFVCGLGPEHINGFKCIHINTRGIPGNKSYRFATPLLQKAELDRELQAFSPDVIHISTPSLLGNYALKAAKRLGVPVISIYHTHFISYVDYYVRNFPFLIDFAKQRVRDILRSFYNQCETLYVPSNSIMQELATEGVNPDVMKLWGRGIDQTLFSPAKRNPERMKRLTGNDNPCILFASRLVWEKNLQTLIKVYDLAMQRRLKYNFVVAGEGAARETVEKQMPEAIFLGHVGHERLAEIYASSSVFFFPSVTETFGNVVLEAMASGLPCVIADSGGSGDFIEDGVNGFKCKPYDAADFLNRITEIIERPGLARQFSEKGRENSKRYIWENLAFEYFEDLEYLSFNLLVV
ncbi:MAG: glycosyltransferase family 1 protein [Tannerellaceae bacterium]|jgi:glycosyltransferase involved in cell wall biosynthesis|nr:glycosyltransferase family 1 protein [Tannerellaceae bacterium]